MKDKFKCSACNYKFLRNQKPNLCPFCGKNTIQFDTTQPAEELLREF